MFALHSSLQIVYARTTDEAATAFSVEITVGISLLSYEQARKNVDMQVGSSSFDQVKAATQNRWRDELGLVQVNTDTQDQFEKGCLVTCCMHLLNIPIDNLIKFYSSLYRAYMGSIFCVYVFMCFLSKLVYVIGPSQLSESGG